MKYVKPVATVATAISLGTGPAHADGMAAPIMEPEVIAEEAAAASLGGFVLPLLFLAIIAAAASSSSSESGGDVPPIIPEE
ncbi:MAG: hypothetical protein QNJ35_15900 [Paracoccaceae bacterium]|nr:hypothetical protein [Paracoccaceae bacterium]